jgi:hypothetical protein
MPHCPAVTTRCFEHSVLAATCEACVLLQAYTLWWWCSCWPSDSKGPGSKASTQAGMEVGAGGLAISSKQAMFAAGRSTQECRRPEPAGAVPAQCGFVLDCIYALLLHQVLHDAALCMHKALRPHVLAAGNSSSGWARVALAGAPAAVSTMAEASVCLHPLCAHVHAPMNAVSCRGKQLMNLLRGEGGLGFPA